MASSRTDIANMALNNIGIGILLSNVDTDGTAEAKACRAHLDVAIETVLRDFDWPFARKYATFNKVADTPTLEWGFSYRYPPDCLNFRYVLTGARRPTLDQQVPFALGQDSSGLLIYTDQPAMQGAYTVKVTNAAFFHPDFVTALSMYLAWLIIPRLSSGDPYKMRPGLAQGFEYSMSKARANAANESQMDLPPESEFIRARNGEDTTQGPRSSL